jgi:hypothetical protein
MANSVYAPKNENEKEARVNETAAKSTAKVKIDIRPGPVMPHMRACWKKWWAARIAEVKSKAKNG